MAAQATKSRDELILEHLPQVNLIARRIHDKLPTSVPVDDLVSCGIVGLINAVDRYDTRKDVKLKTYAEYRIRGAILDGLRQLDWAPRQQRKRARLIEAAVVKLEQEQQRAPGEEEIARQLGLSLEELQDWLAETQALTLGSIEAGRSEEDGIDVLSFVPDTEEQWPSKLLERAELQRLLAEAIDDIPHDEGTVLSLHFYEDMSQRDIAKVLGVHESRVSQLKGQGIRRLKASVRRCWPLTGTGYVPLSY